MRNFRRPSVATTTETAPCPTPSPPVTESQTKPIQSRRAALAAYGTAGLLCLVILVLVMQLHRANLNLPLAYGGDGTYYQIIVKGMVENGWILSNDAISAPTGMSLRDLPTLNHNFYFLLLRLIALFTSNHALIINLFFLLSFPLTTLTTLAVLRHFKLSWPVSIFGSLVYTFLPFHFARGTNHLFLSSYYFVPLMVMVTLWICSQQVSLTVPGRSKLNLRQPKLLLSLLICALAASTGSYFAFFFSFFLLVAGLVAALRQFSFRPLLTSGLLIVVVMAVSTLHLLPNILHFQQNGTSTIVQRYASEADTYGLRVAQLLLPISEHRSSLLADLKGIYNLRLFINENDFVTLGLLGSGGFLLLIGWLFYRRRDDPALPQDNAYTLLYHLSLLNIAGLLLATIGGIGSVIALAFFPQIRSYNRISIYLAFFAIFAVALVLESIARKYLTTQKQRTGFYALLALLLTVGILDQTSLRDIPNYDQISSDYRSDARFVRQIQETMPKDAMIFQLPIMSFPENPKLNLINDYDHARGYLHSQGLRWSYGAIRNRAGDAWQKMVADRPVPEMIEMLCLAGFKGLWIDRFGYTDSGAKLESELFGLLGSSPRISNNNRIAFYDLSAWSQQLQAKYPAASWETKQEEALHPLLPLWGDGFSEIEGSVENNWRWCAEKGRLDIVNSSRQTKEFTLEMSFQASKNGTLRIESPFFSETLSVADSNVPLHKTLTIPPGRHAFKFSCDAPRVLAPLDFRVMVFRVNNFKIKAARPV